MEPEHYASCEGYDSFCECPIDGYPSVRYEYPGPAREERMRLQAEAQARVEAKREAHRTLTQHTDFGIF